MGTPLLTPASPADLRVIICEDEVLLATEMAQQLEAMHVTIAGSVASLGELENLLRRDQGANAAALDIQLLDGEIYSVVPRLEALGIAPVFYSGYMAADCPAHLTHIPWFGKLAPIKDIVDALCAARDARRHDHNH
jgi:hypothetical protein